MGELSAAPRVAFVTGAASGIGLATVKKLLADGYSVALVDHSGPGLERAMVATTAHSGNVISMQADVTSLEELTEAVHATEAALGDLTAVAACAGIEVMGAVLDIVPSDWDRVIAVNLTGVLNTAQATLPSLLRSRGSFVAVSSDAGTAASQGFAAYTASKHGAIGLVRCIALDYGPAGIRANLVAPSFVETPMARRIFAEVDEADEQFYRSAVPLGRFARADEVANAIAHLLGPEASYTNGAVYAIDGGSTAGYFRAIDESP